MSESTTTLEEEVLELYRSPIIGASYNNTFGEENIQSLVEKCRNLDEKKMRIMQGLVVSYLSPKIWRPVLFRLVFSMLWGCLERWKTLINGHRV